VSTVPVLAVTRENADVDGVGALVALSVLHPAAELLVPHGLDPQARSLWADHADDLPTLLQERDLPGAVERTAGGRLFVVDTSRPSRIGSVAKVLERFSEVIALDTHPPEEDDLPRAQLPEAASCTAALACLIAERGLAPTVIEAGVMLVGIHVDTGHFTFPGTTPVDHRGAALCVAWGADPAWVGKYAPRTDGGLDSGALCGDLGGAGHHEAASAVLTGTGLPDALRLAEETLKDRVGRGRRARDLMVRPFVGAAADTPLDSVAELLHRHRINGLPLYEDIVVEGVVAGRRWVGQVSRQEVDAAIRHRLGESPAWQVSARPPGWMRPDAPLSEVRETLLRGQGRIWLVGDADARADAPEPGLLTRTTVLRAVAEPVLGGVRRPPARNVMKGKLRRSLGARWAAVKALGELAAELGMTAWLVGGGVRDLLRDRAVRDADVVVEGEAPDLARAAAERMGGQCHVHPAFHTAKWVPPGWSEHDEPIDVASARAEHYSGRAQLPSVMQADLRRDLYRRDFTINAMAVCLRPERLGEVVDPYGGWDDLQAGVLRVLHGLSFHDDPTRAIRAARFAARFDLHLAPGTRGLLDGAVRSGVFAELGKSRLGAELDRVLEEVDPGHALRKLRSWGLLPVLHPKWTLGAVQLDELSAVMEARREVVGQMRASGDEVPRRSDCGWVVLAGGLDARLRGEVMDMVPGTKPRRERFFEGPEPVREAVRSLAGARRRAHVAGCVRNLDPIQWVVGLGLARRLADAERVEEALWWWFDTGRHIRASIDGRWLQEQGHAPGPGFSKALTKARQVAWDGGDVDAQGQAALDVLVQLAGPESSR